MLYRPKNALATTLIGPVLAVPMGVLKVMRPVVAHPPMNATAA